jgi:hypothetical protein
MKIIIIIFLLLHGLVYLFYAGQANRLFELKPGLPWPDESWAFSRLIAVKTIRQLSFILCLLSTLAFISGSLGIILKWMWWRNAVMYSAWYSSFFFILLWDGKMKRLDDQGGIGILINLAIIMSLYILNWPDFDY